MVGSDSRTEAGYLHIGQNVLEVLFRKFSSNLTRLCSLGRTALAVYYGYFARQITFYGKPPFNGQAHVPPSSKQMPPDCLNMPGEDTAVTVR